MSTAPLFASKALERWSAISIAIITCVLTFGLFIPHFGIYYDETVSFYILNQLDFAHLFQFVWGQARPVAAPLMWLVSDHVEGAHWLMLFFHAGNAVLILLLLRNGLGGYLLPTLLVSIMYCVYPLYWLRPAIINLAIDGSLFFCLLSFALGVAAVHLSGWKQWVTLAIGLLCVPIYFFLYELPFPLEILRPLLFWRALAPAGGSRGRQLKRTFFWSAPWLALTGGLGVYRLFIFENSGFYKSINYNLPGLEMTPGQLGLRAGVVWDQLIGTWSHHLPQVFLTANALGIAIAASIVLLVLLYTYLFSYQLGADLRRQDTATTLALGSLGLLTMLLGQVAVAAARQIPEVEGLASRWNLVASAGASIVVVAMVTFLSNLAFGRRAALVSALCLSTMIGAGAMLQARNAEHFVRDWNAQRNFWWQLAWRIPDLADHTTVIVDHSYQAAQNRPIMIYETLTMGSLFFDNPTIAVVNAREPIPGKWEFDNGSWNLGWSYDRQRAIFVYLNEGCLEVLDPRGPLPNGVKLSPAAERILRSLSSPPAQFIKQKTDKSFPVRLKYFQPEPPHDICYRYEKAQSLEFAPQR
jgi:hypothetical protein